MAAAVSIEEGTARRCPCSVSSRRTSS